MNRRSPAPFAVLPVRWAAPAALLPDCPASPRSPDRRETRIPAGRAGGGVSQDVCRTGTRVTAQPTGAAAAAGPESCAYAIDWRSGLHVTGVMSPLDLCLLLSRSSLQSENVSRVSAPGPIYVNLGKSWGVTALGRATIHRGRVRTARQICDAVITEYFRMFL